MISYKQLLLKGNVQLSWIKFMSLKALTIDVFKSGNNMNPQYIEERFVINEVPYDLEESPSYWKDQSTDYRM